MSMPLVTRNSISVNSVSKPAYHLVGVFPLGTHPLVQALGLGHIVICVKGGGVLRLKWLS